MRKRERQRRRRALWGWIKWTPVLFVIFSVLFLDVLLNIETRRNDYAYSELNQAIVDLREQIKDLKNDRAGLEDLDELAQAAPDLGLLEPAPEQIETIAFSAAPIPLMDSGFAVAQSDPEPMPGDRALEDRIASLLGDVAAIQHRSHDFVRWLRDKVSQPAAPELAPDRETMEAPVVPAEESTSVAEAPAMLRPDDNPNDLLGHL